MKGIYIFTANAKVLVFLYKRRTPYDKRWSESLARKIKRGSGFIQLSFAISR